MHYTMSGLCIYVTSSHNINPYRYTYTYVLTDLWYIHTCIIIHIRYTYSYNPKLFKLNEVKST